jgi:hypothetical protein
MKLNQEQQGFIKARLQSLTYVQETYDELYDHVLTALDSVPDDVPFGNAVHQIIEHDLGGKRSIRAVQRRYIRTAIKDFIGAYFLTLVQSFKSALMLLVVAGTVAYYISVKNEWMSPNGAVIWAMASVIPAAWIRRKLNKGYDWEAHKTNYAMFYVGSYASALMIPLPWGLWLFTSDICLRLQRAGLIDWLPGGYYGTHINSTTLNIATIVFFVTLLHALTFYKMSKNFPMQGVTSN